MTIFRRERFSKDIGGGGRSIRASIVANDARLIVGGAQQRVHPLGVMGISVPGYLNFVSSGQINLQVPWELQGQPSAQVKVIVDGGLFGNVVTVPLSDFTPAFFEGNGIVAAVNATQGNIVTAGTPVHAGDVVELFGNGLGPVNNQPASGLPAGGPPNLATTKTQPVVTIGGQQAPVSFSGLAPGFPGLYQINVTVPSGVAAGTPAITVAIGGKTSKASTLPLK